MNLARLLQSQGFGTRRACRELIAAGRVKLGEETVTDPEREVAAQGLDFSVNGEVWRYREHVYVMLNKPAGYECSRQPKHHPGVLSLLPRPLIERGIQPVGRLDEDSTGLLLLTDDGGFIHALGSGKKHVPKIYRVRTRHAVGEEMLAALMQGVLLNDDPLPVAAAAVEKLDPHSLRLTITAGKYHQVKRMIAACGNRVEALHRESVGPHALPADLAPGQWRWLDAP